MTSGRAVQTRWPGWIFILLFMYGGMLVILLIDPSAQKLIAAIAALLVGFGGGLLMRERLRGRTFRKNGEEVRNSDLGKAMLFVAVGLVAARLLNDLASAVLLALGAGVFSAAFVADLMAQRAEGDTDEGR